MLANALKEFHGEVQGRLLMVNPFIIFYGFTFTKSIVNARGRILYGSFLWIEIFCYDAPESNFSWFADELLGLNP